VKKKVFAIGLSLALFLVLVSSQAALAGYPVTGSEAASSLARAVQYLHRVQNRDGGFPAKPGGESSQAVTCWVIMALEAAGEDVAGTAWAPSGKSPLDYLETCKDDIQETCDYARLLLALSAAAKDPKYKELDLTEKISSFQQSDGAFFQPGRGEKGMINAHMWSVLALASDGKKIPNQDKAREWLLARQNGDGGFSWLEGYQSDADDTGVALQVLVLLGENPNNSTAVKNALAYIKRCQEDNGGFNCGDAWMASGANAASDAWVIQGLIAAGEDPQSLKWSKNGKNAVTHLLSLQNSDGSFNWKEGLASSPVTMTAYAVTALAGKPFPVNVNYWKQSKSASKSVFSDLTPEYWAYDSIMKLVQVKALGGYPDGSFRPENRVTRAEFAVFLYRGLGLEEAESKASNGFADVPKNYWAGQAIAAVVSKGYMKGKPGGLFDPNGKITGAELASILAETLPPDKAGSVTAGPYWYSATVEAARKNGLLYPDFQAALPATRAQCAYSIAQLRNVLGMK